MNVFINHCYHWVSFHMINHLLLSGYTVFGFNDYETELGEHLGMFFGRNSSFKEGKSLGMNKRYDIAVVFHNIRLLEKVPARKKIFITNEKVTPLKEASTIFLPLLFGKWMHMDGKGVYLNDEHILFNSNYFQDEAIYIDDFVRLCSSWFGRTTLPDQLYISRKSTSNSRKIPPLKSVYIYKETNQSKSVQNVISHYKQYKSFYI